MEMNERKKKVLEAVIADYISTAEPVGSRTISRKYDLGVSPATIRNDMADLEEMGFIEQPHTSAGRIPTDAGYRYYVNFLMKRQRLAKNAENLIKEIFSTEVLRAEELIRRSMYVISRLTNYTSLVVSPGIGSATMQTVKMILISPGRALAVIVTSSGQAVNREFSVSEEITQKDLDLLSDVLNNRLKGVSFDEWSSELIRGIHENLSRQKRLINDALGFLEHVLNAESGEKVYLEGRLNILSQPEFRDVERVRNFFGVLEEAGEISHAFDCGEEGITIKIGSENDVEGIRDCSIVFSRCGSDDFPFGSIGVIGPTRMNYSYTLAVLERLSRELDKAFR